LGSGEGPVGGSCALGNKPSGSLKVGNLLTSQVTISFSRRTVLHGGGWLVAWLVSNYCCVSQSCK
jgi:hypothetical protein